jgi:transcriptional regulator with XRE-family HTH domain
MRNEADHACKMLEKWSAEQQRAYDKVRHYLTEIWPSRSADYGRQVLKLWRARERHAGKLVKRWASRVRVARRSESQKMLSALVPSLWGSACSEDNPCKEAVRELLAHLPVESSFILMKRFGLWEGSVSTLEELGQKLGLTRERVRQIERKAKEALAQDVDRIARTAEILKDAGTFEAALAIKLIENLRSIRPSTHSPKLYPQGDPSPRHSRKRNPALLFWGQGQFAPSIHGGCRQYGVGSCAANAEFSLKQERAR